jgi:hypothetical protein
LKRRVFEAIDAAIAREDGSECLHPLTMKGFSVEHVTALMQGA